jgi:type I restriction enzyme S subunit
VQRSHLNLNQYAGGAAQPLLNQLTLKSIEVITPNQSISGLFNTFINSFLVRINSLKDENASLTTLRDTLLPKLISGELRLPDMTTTSDNREASA